MWNLKYLKTATYHHLDEIPILQFGYWGCFYSSDLKVWPPNLIFEFLGLSIHFQNTFPGSGLPALKEPMRMPRHRGSPCHLALSYFSCGFPPPPLHWELLNLGTHMISCFTFAARHQTYCTCSVCVFNKHEILSQWQGLHQASSMVKQPSKWKGYSAPHTV